MRIMNYWAVFQTLLGVWLFVSPFVIGFSELTPAALNSMIVGAIIAVTGLGAFLFEIYHREEVCKLNQMEKKTS
jgi:hypothetical protein